jgi:hypothetical protein
VHVHAGDLGFAETRGASAERGGLHTSTVVAQRRR